MNDFENLDIKIESKLLSIKQVEGRALREEWTVEPATFTSMWPCTHRYIKTKSKVGPRRIRYVRVLTAFGKMLQETTSKLSEEIRKEVDKDILKDLNKIA